VPFSLVLVGADVRIKQIVGISRSCLTSLIQGRDGNTPFSGGELTAIARRYLEDVLKTNYPPVDGDTLPLNQPQFSDIANRELVRK